MTVEPEVGGGGGKADEDRAVDLRRQRDGAEDPGEVEPLPVDPDPLAGVDTVDAEPLGGGRAEHAHRQRGGGGIEEDSLGDGGGFSTPGRSRVAAWTSRALVLIEGMP